MTVWTPSYTANGWWPKLNYPWLAHGVGQCWLTNLAIGAHWQIRPDVRTQAAGWLDATTLCYYCGELPATVFALDVRTGAVRELGVQLANRVVARGGSWATGLAAGGIVTLNGVEVARGVGWRVDVDGPVLACQANDGLHVWVDGNHQPVVTPLATLVDPRVSGGWIGYGYNGSVRAYNVHSGVDLDVTVTPWRKEHAPLVVDGWVWTTTERPDGTSAALGRPMGDPTCLVLPCPSAVYLDVQKVGQEWIVATSGTRGELLVQSIAVDAPRVSLAPTPDPEPEPEPEPIVLPVIIQPYINDPAVKRYNAEQIKPAYKAANRELDEDYPVWSARAVYDHGVGNLSWEDSCARHLEECRAALAAATKEP